MTNEGTPSRTFLTRWMRVASILLLHAVTLFLVSVVLCKLAPGMHDYYRHASIEIPETTSGVIRMSEFCIKFSLPIFCAVMIADLLILLVLTSWDRSKNLLLSMYCQMFLLLALVIVVYSATWLGNPIIWTVP